MKIFRFFGAMFLVFGVMVAAATYSDIVPFYSKSPEGRLQALWNQDIETLLMKKKLPEAWRSIKEVEYLRPATDEAETWLSKVKPQIPIKKDGQYKLQIFLDSWQDPANGQLMAIVQYSLVSLKSSNTIWELGRTFVLNDVKSDAQDAPPQNSNPTPAPVQTPSQNKSK